MRQSIILPAALFLFLGCAVEADLDPGTSGQPIENLGSPAAPNAESPAYEKDMTAGRLGKVPVGWAWYGKSSFYMSGSGTRRIHIRANCVNAAAGQDECDPAMVILDQTDSFPMTTNSVTHVNVDTANTNKSTPYSAYSSFDYAVGTLPRIFTVVVYSHGRGTSKVNIQWDDTVVGGTPDWDGSHTWTNPVGGATISGSNQTVGGTLIKLGPVAVNDTLSVRTPGDGTGVDGTRLFIFNPNRKRFAFVNGSAGGDSDPSFTFTSAWTWSSSTGGIAQTYAVVARDVGLFGTDAEGFVHLHKNASTADQLQPFSWPAGCTNESDLDTARMDCIDNTSTVLPPGRHLLSVWAHPGDLSVGDVGLGENSAAGTGDADACGQGPYPRRGEGNSLAFTVEVEEVGIGVVRTRHVPRGALGTASTLGLADPWSRITIDLEVPDNGLGHAYRIAIRNVGRHVEVRPQWGYRRDAEAMEFRIATANIQYHLGVQTSPSVRNAVDLLARGPDFTGTSEVKFRQNTGYWRWETDIQTFNEIMPSNVATMESRLDTSSNLIWNVSDGTGVTDVFTGHRRNPVFVNELLTPLGGENSVQFPASVMDQVLDPDTQAQACFSNNNTCRLGGLDEQNQRTYYVVPARAQIRATGATGDEAAVDTTPVVVFSLYLPPDEQDEQVGSRHMAERELFSDRLLDRMSSLLALRPFAFNGEGQADDRSPGNRMVVLGDFNMKNHQCSEVNDLLRRMRERFGYAVDVSMAAVDPATLRTHDTHYSGAPITDLRTGRLEACTDPLWADTPHAGTACPFHFKHSTRWNDEANEELEDGLLDGDTIAFDTSAAQWHDWWSGPGTKKGGSSSRLDVILLVGLGWADDDPVRQYMTIANREDTPNPMNGYDTAAIEMRDLCNDTKSPELVSAGSRNYAPEAVVCGPAFNYSGEPVGSGHTVYRSDHKPIGVRLRSLMGR